MGQSLSPLLSCSVLHPGIAAICLVAQGVILSLEMG